MFIEYECNQSRIRNDPTTDFCSILQNECTFAAIHHQSVRNLVLVGSRQKTFRAGKGKCQFIAGTCRGNVVSIFVFRQFYIVEVQQCKEIVAAVRFQIRQQIRNRSGISERISLHLSRSLSTCKNKESGAFRDVQQILLRYFGSSRRRFFLFRGFYQRCFCRF